MRVRIAVSFEMPKGATRQDCVDYVMDAVSTMKGCYKPDGWDGGSGEGDPLFYLDSDTVAVTCSGYRGNRRYILRG